MKNIKLYSILILFLTLGFPALAQEKNEDNEFEQVIQEFPFSQPVYLQETLEFQQTLRGEHFENKEEIANILGYEGEFGLTDWLQVSAGYSYEHHNFENIPYDTGWLETGVVLGLFNNSLHAAALAFEAEFPLNKAEIDDIETEDSPSYSPVVIYAFKLNNFQVHLNAGAEFEDKEVTWLFNAATVYGNGNFHPLLELNAVSEEDFNWYAGTGLVINGESGWEFGAGIRRGIINSDWNAIFNLIYEFNFKAEED